MSFPRTSLPALSLADQIAIVIAEAGDARFEEDPNRFGRLTLAPLKLLARPTEGMVDAAHEAVWSDALWAINSRADLKKAVRAIMRAAMVKEQLTYALLTGRRDSHGAG